MDDDDVYVPGAVAVMRKAATESDGRPLLFRFESYHRGADGERMVFWAQRGLLARHYVGGHCLVTPNLPGFVGRFGVTYQGDFDYVESTINLHGGPKVAIWRDEIIVIARPGLELADVLAPLTRTGYM